MREIKFRAWHKDERLMCDIDTLNINDGAFLIGVKPEEDYLVDGGKTWVIAPENGRYCGIDEIEIMQFTGLYDYSGDEIYEGDILDGWWDGNLSVVFFNGEFVVEYMDNDHFAILDHHNIIGNIHENKDLLT